MRTWLNRVSSICELVRSGDFSGQKAILLDIYGSNLFLHNKTLLAAGEKKTQQQLENCHFERGQNGNFLIYNELKKLNEKVAVSGDSFEFFPDVVGEEGIEPSIHRNTILSRARIPVPPLARDDGYFIIHNFVRQLRSSGFFPSFVVKFIIR